MYLNKDMIKCIAARLSDVSFNIDFFEYSEKKGYSTNNNTVLRPEIENWNKNYQDKRECFGRNSVGISNENGNLCNFQIEKRYINIEDVSSIKNNQFYYDILEKLPLDNRIKEVKGKITSLSEISFNIQDNKFLIDDTLYGMLKELYENVCDIVVMGYKINCLNQEYDIFKIITIYIE